MSEDKKPTKAKTSSTKKATPAKKSTKKDTSTKKTTTKKVAKEKVEKVTKVEEQEVNIVTEMPEYQEIAVQQPEEINMNNEEIKVTEENNEEAYEEQVPTTSEPKVDIYTPPVTEGYKATRLDTNTIENSKVEDNTAYAFDDSTPAEPINIEANQYTSEVVEQPTYSEVTPAVEPINFAEPNAVVVDEPVQEPIEEQASETVNEPVYNEEINQIYTNPVVEEAYQEPVQISEPVIKKEKKKKDVRSILLIILFIFLFAFIMGMPYINEFLDNLKKDAGLSPIEQRAREIEREQQKQNPKAKVTDDGEIVKDKLTTLTCTLESTDTTIVEAFSYNSKGQVLESSKTTTYKFTTQDDKYNNLKDECNNNSLKYVEKKGFEVACSYNDTEVEISNKFDLSTFTTINDGMTKIEANAKYKEKVDSVKKRMAQANYTCE